ncbi:hypothetical protein AB3S75_000102 [Citrus x aurantiifolia]
MKLRFQAD